MEYSDNKNILLTLPVKNGVPLVIMTAYTICDFLALIPHSWRTGQEAKGALQAVGVIVGLENTEVKQGMAK